MVEFVTRMGRIASPDCEFYLDATAFPRVPVVGDTVSLSGAEDVIWDGLRVVGIEHQVSLRATEMPVAYSLILHLGGPRDPHRTLASLMRAHRSFGEGLRKAESAGTISGLAWSPLTPKDFHWALPWRSRF